MILVLIDTPIVVAYQVLEEDEAVALSLHYGILGSDDLLILKRKVSGEHEHIDYTTDNDGYYCICLQGGEEATEPSRVKLAVTYGYDSDYYKMLAEEQHFDDINLDVHILNDQMNLILREADYQKHKEVEFHAKTEEMNSGSLWWPMLQVSILVATAILQAHHMKAFFKSNKLI